jgi:hypothetical protein
VHAFAKEEGYQQVSTDIVYSEKPGVKTTKHLIEFKFEDLKNDLFGTPATPRLLIWNSYNGECALSINVGVYRVVCANGLTVGQEIFQDRAVHMEDSGIIKVVAEFQDKLKEALDYVRHNMIPSLTERMNTDIQPADVLRIVRQLGQDGALSLRNVDRIINHLSLDLETGDFIFCNRKEDRDLTLWNLYNIINEVMRNTGRSTLAQEMKNVKLMDRLLKIAV